MNNKKTALWLAFMSEAIMEQISITHRAWICPESLVFGSFIMTCICVLRIDAEANLILWNNREAVLINRIAANEPIGFRIFNLFSSNI